jgi:hypothetical protein
MDFLSFLTKNKKPDQVLVPFGTPVRNDRVTLIQSNEFKNFNIPKYGPPPPPELPNWKGKRKFNEYDPNELNAFTLWVEKQTSRFPQPSLVSTWKSLPSNIKQMYLYPDQFNTMNFQNSCKKVCNDDNNDDIETDSDGYNSDNYEFNDEDDYENFGEERDENSDEERDEHFDEERDENSDEERDEHFDEERDENSDEERDENFDEERDENSDEDENFSDPLRGFLNPLNDNNMRNLHKPKQYEVINNDIVINNKNIIQPSVEIINPLYEPSSHLEYDKPIFPISSLIELIQNKATDKFNYFGGATLKNSMKYDQDFNDFSDDETSSIKSLVETKQSDTVQMNDPTYNGEFYPIKKNKLHYNPGILSKYRNLREEEQNILLTKWEDMLESNNPHKYTLVNFAMEYYSNSYVNIFELIIKYSSNFPLLSSNLTIEDLSELITVY